MNNPQAQSENDTLSNDWTPADEAAYLEWIEATVEGQQELEDLYWSARAAVWAQEQSDAF